ncbi:MAG: purine-nucleoside phosphorylase [Deltaproteobacteria bacterium]|nr:purine-nucleoside phosphorylase [Deltaproteobacteria bacterium]MBK8693323.1 purine-nucleoside phosphorylase [Deltaproteobacteria bacterium]
MTSLRERLDESVAALRARDPRVPSVALVLGSGLGAFADTLVDATVIPFSEVPHLAKVTVPGHAGKLVIGRLREGPSPVVAALAGRIHLYEGHSPDDVVFNVRALLTLGARTLVVTNAAGGISPTLRPGDLALLTDHLNLTGRTPLAGPNEDSLGPRFPDMTDAYDPGLRRLAHSAAESVGQTLREGIYAGLLGPSYETPAEIRMLRSMGADLVGMSTVAEVIAARHMGAKVLGMSCVTNLAAGVSPHALSHAEVEETARLARDRFIALLEAILRGLA